ncbi:MAG: nuclear transport factor 2 family protein, partial [bacterium]
LLYLDPNTRGAITDQDSMRRYLTKLLAAWDMHWSLREAHLFEGQEGGAFLWRASIKKAGGEKTVEIDGMDLILIEGDKIKRNEVYFDRAALAPLM